MKRDLDLISCAALCFFAAEVTLVVTVVAVLW